MERIEKFLQERKSKGLLRQLCPASKRANGKIEIDGREFLDFCSNDYLSLSSHPDLIEAGNQAARRYGTGSAASRLLSGDLQIHHNLENQIAGFKGKPVGLVFNSGYQANLGIISALCGKSDAVFCDKLAHASILDGVRLSGARLFRFRHNSPNHLQKLLDKNRDKFEDVLVITESVFSMDGDIAPLADIAKLGDRYDCTMIVDEAHATGIFGDTGSGELERQGVTDDIELIMGTFSKGLGSFGGYLACSGKMKEFLINSARSFIYSTSLPASVIAADSEAIRLVNREPERRRKLLENSDYFRKSLKDKGLEVPGSSQIIPVVTGGIDLTRRISCKLYEKGFYVLPILPPTVPPGQARLRFSLNYAHTKDQLDEVIDAVTKITK
jgi:8-amino-7-oxononanoate synthase